MRKFVIERDIPGAGKLTDAELKAIVEKSCATVEELNKPYHWQQTFVAGDKFYCVHIAEDEATVREHAARGGFPVSSVTEVRAVIDPSSYRNI